jgi:hypothetical protein
LSGQDEPLYPEIEPYRHHRVAVSGGHELHVEESGNPRGLPVVILHSRPGAGAKPGQRRTFDPAAFRIMMLDQRGAGRSTPHADVGGNTTEAHVADLETVRMHLGIDRWLVAGGSWGRCLALCYGETHLERCLGYRIRHLSAEIVQGRYDTVTPMATAWRLKNAWPEAHFTIVDEANPVATPRALALSRALREATDRLRDTVLAEAA